MADRKPPIEAEQSVLGAVMLDNAVWPILADQLRAADFVDPRHRELWVTLDALAKQDQPLDEVTVVTHLRTHGRVDDAGGALYLAELVERVPSAANVDGYAKAVREAAGVRALYAAARDAVKALESGDEVATVRERLQVATAAIDAREPDQFFDARDDMQEILTEMEHRHERGTAVSSESFLSTGYPSIDRVIVGLASSSLVILSARSNVGKTALALNMTSRQAINHAARIAFFSGEQPRRAIARRLLACTAPVNHHVLRAGLFNGEDWPRAVNAHGKIARGLVLVNDTISTIDQVCAMALRAHLRAPLSCVYVDFLQHLVPREEKNQNREQAVATAAKNLKNLARKIGAPVVALSQLNKDGGLRESEAIFHVADLVVELDRPGAEEGSDKDPADAAIKVRKNRDGGKGTIPLRFVESQVRFEESAGREIAAPPHWLDGAT